MQAAQEEGLLTAKEVDQVLHRAAANTAEMLGSESPATIVGSAEECAGVMERLFSAGKW